MDAERLTPILQCTRHLEPFFLKWEKEQKRIIKQKTYDKLKKAATSLPEYYQTYFQHCGRSWSLGCDLIIQFTNWSKTHKETEEQGLINICNRFCYNSSSEAVIAKWTNIEIQEHL